ncbi:glutaminase A [Rubrivivax rivuli]|uniref:Glutaminase n=1 Tax=Rubrivivax rivuli TaxID=1862385 RepID=A0A437RCM7_9BURK|nr:glutaminase A [Rubrivivax rivuli]RVU44509.1 glutaminase A [Rubrivivax rivuli]
MSPPRPEAPTFPIQAYLQKLHRTLSAEFSGQAASYIPELAKADPAWFGIVITTVDGQVYEVGDSRQPFTMQSVSKALVYGVALEDAGAERVRRTVGVEPSGEAFNSISLEPGTGRPLNPMINAGAIAATSLVGGAGPQERLARIVSALSRYAGRPLAIDEAVFESERDTGHRNRAIGHLLRSFGILDTDPEATLDLYFRQCSLLVDAHALAMMAATLANGGVNPATGERAVQAELVGPILSVMTTCGVYDFTGEWVYRVGLPAKSGVGGGIMAVLPGQLGIGVFSPLLDERGNSVRGVKVCEALSRDLGLHFLRPPRLVASTVRTRYTLAQMRSKRQRTAEERQRLAEHGHTAQVLELQGDLRFSTLEPVLREVEQAGDTLALVMLDFRRVTGIDPAATRLLAALVNTCAARGQEVVLSRVRRGDLQDDFQAEVHPRHQTAVLFQPQLDLGLEWCERRLLERHTPARPRTEPMPLSAHPLCAGAPDRDLAWLEAHAPRQTWEPGSWVLRRGDAADSLYLLLRGEVSVLIGLPKGGSQRLSTLSAGASFGEAALLDAAVRGADVRADVEVECAVLSVAALRLAEQEHPALALRIFKGLLRSAAATTARLTGEVEVLEG